MYHACMHTRPPARLARRAAAPPPKVALLAPEDNQSSAKALEPTFHVSVLFSARACMGPQHRIMDACLWVAGGMLGWRMRAV